jgi:hypothetical protein
LLEIVQLPSTHTPDIFHTHSLKIDSRVTIDKSHFRCTVLGKAVPENEALHERILRQLLKTSREEAGVMLVCMVFNGTSAHKGYWCQEMAVAESANVKFNVLKTSRRIRTLTEAVIRGMVDKVGSKTDSLKGE